MKKLTKFLCIFLSLFFIFMVGCKKENPLLSHVSELRCDLFEGKSENFSLIACYGFKELPYVNDGEVGEKVYLLTFRLLNKDNDDVEYTITFKNGEQDYHSKFKLNPVSHSKTASFEIENLTEKTLKVVISCASLSEEITIHSIKPQNTISYQKALDYLYENEKDLLSVYTDENDDFNAEIYMRIVVKNNKPYWYVGLASGNENLKALLIDGLSGKTLAVRDIF